MPSHQDRREPLPAGYQFGDAKYVPIGGVEPLAYIADRAKYGDKAYRGSVRERILFSWNDIERGEH